MQSSRRRPAACLYCGAEYPAGALACPNCGRSFKTDEMPAVAEGAAPGVESATVPSPPKPPAEDSPVRKYLPAPDYRSALPTSLESTPVLVGLAMIALVLVVVVGALVLTRGGGARATSSAPAVAAGSPAPATPSPLVTSTATPNPTETPTATPQATPTQAPVVVHGPTAVTTRAHGFSTTGSMEVGRAMQTATLLNNGRVLVAGGGVATAELYDPTTGRFTSTGSMSEARSGQTATLLLDGRVLIVGGAADATAELYDPATGRFSATGSMAAARSSFTATLLKSGRVLIAGGNKTSAVAELYDPATKGFTPTGSLRTNRSGHAATLLPDGYVLITGGADSSSRPLASAELYNPATGEFSVTNSLNDARTAHSATLLKNGHVLIAGGNGGCGPLASGATCAGASLTSAETYDPKTRIFSRAGAMLVGQGESSGLSAATLLADGRVLFTGGAVDSGAVLRTAELYDPASGRFALAGSLVTARDNHTMTLLHGGSVLITGGEDGASSLSSAEIYKP